MSTAEAAAVTDAELASLFADLDRFPALVLAVSGGPDSTALMWLAARWHSALKRQKKPKLIVVTVDHGLRKEAKAEAAAVAKLARRLKLAHRTVRWTGRKPKTGLQQAARFARYRLLAEAARKAGAGAILTAHTLDDQAETVLIRLCRGSGLAGLGGMARVSPLPCPSPEKEARGKAPLSLIRPLLDVSKARLVATLKAAKIPFAEDASNLDPRFTRVRLRGLMPELTREGLDARRLARLARRLTRANAALEAATDRAGAEVEVKSSAPGPIVFDAVAYRRLPEEVRLRLLGRAVAAVGTEGPVELAKLEGLADALDLAGEANRRFCRTLAGAIVTFSGPQILIEPAPPRRRNLLTTGGTARAGRGKPR